VESGVPPRTSLATHPPGVLLILLFAGFQSVSPTHAQIPTITWVKAVSGPGDEYGWGVAVDPFTNALATGHFMAPANIGTNRLDQSGNENILLEKFDPLGNLIWVRQAGGPGFDQGRGVAADATSHVYLTGGFNGPATFGPFNLDGAGGGDVFLAKYDQDGNLLWVRSGGGPGEDQGRAVAVDPDGRVYLTGIFRDAANFDGTNVIGAGLQDIVIAKYDSEGELQWVRSAGGTGGDHGHAITTDGGGHVLITGSFTGEASFGSLNLTGAGGDVFVAQYDAQGQPQWIRQGGSASTSPDIGYDIVTDEAGEVYVTGVVTGDAVFDGQNLTHRGQGDVFVARYSARGVLRWVQSFGDTGPDEGQGVGLDAAGNIYVAGLFLSQIAFGSTVLLSPGHSDVFVVKLSPDGGMLWAVQAGGSAYKSAPGFAVTPAGTGFITGFFRGTTAFGSFMLTNDFLSNRDMFLARVDGPIQPRLHIDLAGNQVVLSWLDTDPTFQLESKGTLSTNELWLYTGDASAIVNGRRRLTNLASGASRFFRLRAP
jgi:hypothetical protein